MHSRSSALLVTFDPGVSPTRSKTEKLITRSRSLAQCDRLGWTAADRVCCEKQAAAWSVTASVVNYLCFAVIGDQNVGIYASRVNWHTSYSHMPIGMVGIYRLLFLSPHANRHVGNIPVTVCLFVCPQDFW